MAMALMINSANTYVYADDYNYEVGISFEQLVEALDDDVEVIDGQFILDLSQNEIEKIGQDNYDSILEGIEYVNELLQTEAYDVTENGTIYETDDELTIQGGNVDKVVYKWWGIKRYASKKNAKKIASKFNTISNSAWMFSGSAAATAAVNAMVPEPFLSKGAASLATLVSALSGVGAGYFGLIATRIDAKNGSRGVIINLTWVGVFTVSKQ